MASNHTPRAINIFLSFAHLLIDKKGLLKFHARNEIVI